jgi:transmembrane sensor
MSRRATLLDAARWAMREDESALAEPPPRAAADVQNTLDDPALGTALAEIGMLGRLSDAEVRTLREGRRRAIGSGLAMALVAVVGVSGWSSGWFGAPAAVTDHFETRRGEQRIVRLRDGSTLRLDGATSLDVTLSADRRTVDLGRGEAYFDVAHEEGRPFVVRAGGSATRVLGTAFTVDLGNRGVKLAVYRGRVRSGNSESDRGAVLVPAGWRSRFINGAARAPTPFDATQQDWRGAWVDTDEMQLGELIERLNRRDGPPIMAPSPKLAAIPLAGRFRLDDPRQILEAMGDVYGFRVVAEKGRLRLAPTG